MSDRSDRESLRQKALHAISRVLRRELAKLPDEGEVEVIAKVGTSLPILLKGPYQADSDSATDDHSKPPPAGAPAPSARGNEFNRCARDINRTLEKLGRRVPSFEKLQAEMQARGFRWSLSTIKRSFLLLKRSGVDNRPGQGIGFSDWE